MSITDPIYSDANAAREHLEALHWPHGPVCPRCGSPDRITKLAGKSTRPGVYKCNECAKPFSVTVGTVMEDSKIPLNKWLLAFRLLAGGKKGFSAHELHRALGITYKSAWFLEHRIREAMKSDGEPMGGPDVVVEADETYVGKAKNRATRKPAPKKAVVALVERDGMARSFHVANVTANALRPLIVTNVDRASHLMTDESGVYTRVGREFNGHSTVTTASASTSPRAASSTPTRSKLLLYLQAWRDWHLSPHERGAPRSLLRGVRFPLQHAEAHGCRASRYCGCLRTRQAPYVPATSFDRCLTFTGRHGRAVNVGSAISIEPWRGVTLSIA